MTELGIKFRLSESQPRALSLRLRSALEDYMETWREENWFVASVCSEGLGQDLGGSAGLHLGNTPRVFGG